MHDKCIATCGKFSYLPSLEGGVTIQPMYQLRFDWLQLVFASRYRWLSILAILILALLVGIAGGWVVATAGALITAALVVGAAAGLWALRDMQVGFAGVFAIICLLPFGAVPLPFSPKPTFLDLAVGVLFFVWILQIATGYQRDFIATPLGLPVMIFFLVVVMTFIVGLGHAPLNQMIARRFVELLGSILLFFLTVNVVRSEERLQRLTRFLMVGGTLAALVAIVLYVLPELTSFSLLLRLQRLGYYPEGGAILRYIEDDPSLPQRAIGTSVDPNTLGGLLMVVLSITIPQVLARRALFPRWISVAVAGIMGVALLLTFSRGSFAGLAVALLALAVLRYRKLLPLLLAAGVLILILPWTQDYVTHLVEGLQLQDLATQMRLGEYKDALILIQRYPWLGVGFTGAPDIDIYLGVANVYLTIAGQMGVAGLAAFLIIVLTWLVAAIRARKLVAHQPLEAVWWGYHAAILALLVHGVFDHYFFNLSFHHAVTLFWIVLALTVTSGELARERNVV